MKEQEVATLGSMFPLEQRRCRELLKQYTAIGPSGAFGYAMIEMVLQRADQAASSGDVVAMLRSYEEMRGCK